MSLFRANCTLCCGLCCVAPAFFAIQGFGQNKSADKACEQLNGASRCSVYANRAAVGYRACVGFDCYGAGQFITQELFAGAKWTDSQELRQQMFDAYRYWAPRFEAAALLDAAIPRLGPDSRARLELRIASLLSKADHKDRAISDDPVRLKREAIAFICSMMSSEKKTE